MENYNYRCKECGFVYQVPEYWVNYSPEQTMEFSHIDFETRETCENFVLELVDEEQG